ncbi:hypothetical protein BGZ68_007561 [Mortierella alpina]|nr:hypothetical protein BGZ68_007561 [Mortierella alpina]
MASSGSPSQIGTDTTHEPSIHASRQDDPALGQSETRTGVRGAGTGTGSESGPGTRRSTISHHSVHIVLPEEEDDDAEDDHTDNRSISSRSSYSTCSSSAGSAHVCSRKNDGAFIDYEGEVCPSSRQLFWTYVGLTPVLLSILALFAGLLQSLPAAENGILIHWDRFGVGVIGWLIAFGFRTPIFALFSRVLHLSDNLCEWCTLLSGAALEETLRLGLIILMGIGQDFGHIYWMGLGWAGIETAYYIVQSLVYSRWLSDDDNYRAVYTTAPPPPPTYEGYGAVATQGPLMASSVSNNATKAVVETRIDNINDDDEDHNSNSNVDENDHDVANNFVPTRVARHLLGIDRPWWSLMGRTSSMMVHIGLGCWLGNAGWVLLLPAALVHGTLYVIWGVFLPDQWSVPATSYGTFIAAMAIFFIGLALYGQIV